MTLDGRDYDPKRDEPMVKTQLARMRAIMVDGEWRTLPELSEMLGISQNAVAARLRDLRKPRYGGYHVERRREEHTEGLVACRFVGVLGVEHKFFPAQLTPFSMFGAIQVLRRIYPRLNKADQQAVAPLGRWLGVSLGEKAHEPPEKSPATP